MIIERHDWGRQGATAVPERSSIFVGTVLREKGETPGGKARERMRRQLLPPAKETGTEVSRPATGFGNVASFDAFVENVKRALSRLGATRFDYSRQQRWKQSPQHAVLRRLPRENWTPSITPISKTYRHANSDQSRETGSLQRCPQQQPNETSVCRLIRPELQIMSR